MQLTPLTRELEQALRANAILWEMHERRDLAAPDPVPGTKLFAPCGLNTWLLTELDRDWDMLFSLADLGSGCIELGRFSLGADAREIVGTARHRAGTAFLHAHRLSVWVREACAAGSMSLAEAALRARNGR